MHQARTGLILDSAAQLVEFLGSKGIRGADKKEDIDFAACAERISKIASEMMEIDRLGATDADKNRYLELKEEMGVCSAALLASDKYEQQWMPGVTAALHGTSQLADFLSDVDADNTGRKLVDATSKIVVDGAHFMGQLGTTKVDPMITSGAGGLLRDSLWIAKPCIETGFKVGQKGANAGFEIIRYMLCKVPFKVASNAGMPNTATVLSRTDSALETVQGWTERAIHITKDATHYSVDKTDSFLAKAGVEKGDSCQKIMTAYCLQKNDGSVESKIEMCDALLSVARVIATARPSRLGAMIVSDPIRLFHGLSALAEEQKSCRERDIHVIQRQVHAKTDQVDWKHLMMHAAAAFGPKVNTVLGITSDNRIGIGSFESGIEFLTQVAEEDIVTANAKSDLYMPAHYLAVDHSIKKVVISIRGTCSLQDVIVDLVCEPKELEPFEWESVNGGDSDRIKFGYVHSGFWAAANRLSELLEFNLESALAKYPEYSLVIVGHSYGGAVASLLCILWAASRTGTHQQFVRRNLHSYSFGAPCSVCNEMSSDQYVQQRVTSVVLGNDFVSRLSLQSFMEMQETLLHITSNQKLEAASRMEVKGSTDPIEKSQAGFVPVRKLYPPGQVWYIHSEDQNSSKYQPVLVNPVTTTFLNTVQITPNMFTVHMPNKYIEALSENNLSHDVIND